MELVSLQGKCYLASRDSSGNPEAFYDVGDVASLQLQLSEQTQELREHSTGNRNRADVLATAVDMKGVLTLNEWITKNLLVGLFGAEDSETGATVAAETLPAALALGDYVRLAHPLVSSVVVKDSAGTPATLTAGTDYEVANDKTGLLHILGDLSAYTQPLTAGYTYANYDSVAAFGVQAPVRWLRFEGVNTTSQNQGQKWLVEVYMARFSPAKNLDLLMDNYGTIELDFQALYDSSKASDTKLYQFGRMINLGV